MISIHKNIVITNPSFIINIKMSQRYQSALIGQYTSWRCVNHAYDPDVLQDLSPCPECHKNYPYRFKKRENDRGLSLCENCAHRKGICMWCKKTTQSCTIFQSCQVCKRIQTRRDLSLSEKKLKKTQKELEDANRDLNVANIVIGVIGTIVIGAGVAMWSLDQKKNNVIKK